MDRRDELPREHDPHDLAHGVRRVDAPDAQAVRHLERERGLAHAGGAAEQDDHGPLGVLVLAPEQVALRGRLAHVAREGLVGEAAQLAPVDLAHVAGDQRALDLARDVEGVVRIDRGGEQRLREHALRERQPLSGGAEDRDVDGDGNAALLLERLVAQDLAHPRRDLALVHARARADATPHLVGGAVGVLEGNPPRHQRVHHDPAHEGTGLAVSIDRDPPRGALRPGGSLHLTLRAHPLQPIPPARPAIPARASRKTPGPPVGYPTNGTNSSKFGLTRGSPRIYAGAGREENGGPSGHARGKRAISHPGRHPDPGRLTTPAAVLVPDRAGCPERTDPRRPRQVHLRRPGGAEGRETIDRCRRFGPADPQVHRCAARRSFRPCDAPSPS